MSKMVFGNRCPDMAIHLVHDVFKFLAMCFAGNCHENNTIIFKVTPLIIPPPSKMPYIMSHICRSRLV